METGGYIITIVGLNESNKIEFGSSSTTGTSASASASKVYHLTINNKTKKSLTENVEIKNLQLELKKLEATPTTPYTVTELPILTGVLFNNAFEVKYAEKDTDDKIIVSDNAPTTAIGGKKRSQHKYSRKR